MNTVSAHGSRKLTAEQAAAVKHELNAILSSEQFSGTMRCHDFLKFVVNSALAGDYENLTERALGAELFGRPIDYETGSDAIVRVRANDVRHRLAEYYSRQRSASQVRINLASGSYIPEFHWLDPEAPGGTAGTAAGPIPAGKTAAGLETTLEAKRRIGRNRLMKIVPIAAAVLVALGAVWLLQRRNPEPPDRALRDFWQPLVQERSPVIVCFGNTVSFWPSQSVRDAIADGNLSLLANPGPITETHDDTVTVGNLRAAVSILNLLHDYGVSNELRWPQEVQSADLDKSSVVFIGAFNNPWTMSMTRDLRFSFRQSLTATSFTWMIQDRNSPGQQWSITKPYPEQSTVDYALITRIIDRDQKRVVIIVGGLGQFGTQAAGEFISNEAALNTFARSAPRGWQSRNIQIVLQMEVDGRKIVNPRIVATNIW